MLLITLIFIFSSVSCKKDEQKKIKGSPAAENAVDDVAAKENNEKLIKKENTENKKEEPKLENASTVGKPRQADFLLFFPQDRKEILYTDFIIGELQNKKELTKEKDIALFELSEKFLQNLQKKQIDDTLFVESKLEFIQKNLNTWFKNLSFNEYRLGRLNLVSLPQSVNVRLISKDKFYDGIIYFIYDEGWKVFDFHLNSGIIKRTSSLEKWEPVSGKEDNGYVNRKN